MKVDKKYYWSTGITLGVLLVLAIAGKLALSAMGVKNIDSLKARMALNKGVQAFASANYEGAAEHFTTASDLDSELLDARVYLAYSHMMQYIPGVESPENEEIANKALDGFKAVLADDPENSTSVQSIASLYFQMKKLDEAKEWHQKVIAAQPDNKESFYTIGVINWTRSYEPRLQLRADLGMEQADPGPIKDAKKRQELAEELLPVIDEGLQNLEKALAIDPDYTDAMAYTNLLLRERADFADTKAEHEEYLAKADDWVQRTLDTKKRLTEESTFNQFAAEEE